MRDWLKCLLAFCAGVAVALAIALPATLIPERECTPIDDDVEDSTDEYGTIGEFTTQTGTEMTGTGTTAYTSAYTTADVTGTGTAGTIQDVTTGTGYTTDVYTTGVPLPESGQRFPNYTFVSFDDMWSGDLNYRSFNFKFSKLTPKRFFCRLKNGRILKYTVDKYKDGEDCEAFEDGKEVAGRAFATWYSDNEMVGYSISADEKYVFAYNNYMKQWRHSFFADYYVFDLTNNEEIKTAGILAHKQAQFVMWSPTDHTLLWVSNEKNIYYQKNLKNEETIIQVTDTGGWCIDDPRILGTVYNGTTENCIYNGVPDWNYEEEGGHNFGTRSAIYWSPDSTMFTFVVFDVSQIETLKYSVYPEYLAAPSPNDVDYGSFEQYPRVNTIKYAKTADKIVKTQFYIVKIVTNQEDHQTPHELNRVGAVLEFDIGIGLDDSEDQENRYFSRLSWAPSSNWFVMTWISRACTQAKSLACEIPDGDVMRTKCEQIGREDGGSAGSWDEMGNWINEEGGNMAGWIGSFGPFTPIATSAYKEFFNIHSFKIDDAVTDELHPYGMAIQDGFWNVAKQAPKGVQDMDHNLKGVTWLTDSREERWSVTQLEFYDSENDYLYFMAARSESVGSDADTEQHKRQIFRVIGSAEEPDEPECVTCVLDTEENHCGWVTIRRNCALGDENNPCNEMIFIVNCRGHNIPQSYRTVPGQEFGAEIEWTLIESNAALTEYVEEHNVPKVEYGIWENEKLNTTHNYEMWLPVDFDPSSGKLYPVFLEVYAGIEFQKIEHRYKGYSGGHWPQIHLPAAYDCITISVDGRGSAFQGDAFMFAMYKAIGHTEREDQTDFVRWFSEEGPYAEAVDKSRISVFGWSYGGFTTTHILGYGGGGDPVFTSGVAVAPVGDWRYYDAMYAERYMDYQGVDGELLQPHWVNQSMIQRPIIENEMEHFSAAQYSIIHGTNDDNVHFMHSTQMQKQLTKRGIEFDSAFYADEDHSIASTVNTKKHVYKSVIKRILHSWGFVWNGESGEER